MHVLLVDDNADITGMLSLLLEAQGYRVSTAGTGAEALRCLEAQGADVVLCDLGLPDIDGAELAQRLRAQPAWAELPLVALTGRGGDDDRAETAAAGFDAHLVKPVAGAELARTLARFARD